MGTGRGPTIGYGVIRGDMFSSRTGPQARVAFLDEMRGLCILLMVLYHAVYTTIFLFGWDITLPGGTRLLYFLFTSPVILLAQPFVAGIFIFISGIACRYSRSNLRRGAIALGLGLVITAFTLRFMPEVAIYFGILHFLGSGMILFALFRRPLDRLPGAVGLLLCLILFALTVGIRAGYLGIPGLFVLSFPAAWSQVGWMIPIGFAGAGADHFPLLPWLFLFFAGAYLGIYFVRRDMPAFFYKGRSPFLGRVGRYTIYIYILHQPVVFGVLYGVDLLVSRIGA